MKAPRLIRGVVNLFSFCGMLRFASVPSPKTVLATRANASDFRRGLPRRIIAGTCCILGRIPKAWVEIESRRGVAIAIGNW